MANLLESYAEVVGRDVIDQLHQLAGTLRDKRVVHVNSTRFGGGIAEFFGCAVDPVEEPAVRDPDRQSP